MHPYFVFMTHTLGERTYQKDVRQRDLCEIKNTHKTRNGKRGTQMPNRSRNYDRSRFHMLESRPSKTYVFFSILLTVIRRFIETS